MIARSRLVALTLSASSALILTGCPVDSRVLEPADSDGGRAGSHAGAGSLPTAGDAGAAGSGGSDGVGGSSGDDAGGAAAMGGSAAMAGGGGTPGRGGTGGIAACPCAGGSSAGTSGSAGRPAVPTCPDLDGNRVADCDETLVENAAFHTDTGRWNEETGLTIEWNETDGEAREDSGSLQVEHQSQVDRDGDVMAGARQCLGVTGGTLYQVVAQVQIPAGQPAGSGGLYLAFFDDEACTGTLIGSNISNLVTAPMWRSVLLAQRAPPAAKSALLRLVSVKPLRQPSVRVLFDNVLARED